MGNYPDACMSNQWQYGSHDSPAVLRKLYVVVIGDIATSVL